MSNVVKKWVIELQEFEFSFLVEDSTRATLADLLTHKENPLLVKEEVVKRVVKKHHRSAMHMFFSLMAHIGRAMMRHSMIQRES